MFNSSLAFWTKKSCKKRTMKDESSLFLPYKAEKYLRVKQCKITTQEADKFYQKTKKFSKRVKKKTMWRSQSRWSQNYFE